MRGEAHPRAISQIADVQTRCSAAVSRGRRSSSTTNTRRSTSWPGPVLPSAQRASVKDLRRARRDSRSWRGLASALPLHAAGASGTRSSPKSGRARERERGLSPQSSFATVATRRRGDSRSRCRGRMPTPRRILPLRPGAFSFHITREITGRRPGRTPPRSLPLRANASTASQCLTGTSTSAVFLVIGGGGGSPFPRTLGGPPCLLRQLPAIQTRPATTAAAPRAHSVGPRTRRAPEHRGETKPRRPGGGPR